MTKVLLISYYWPPAGGPGVHRWLRFSKYFQENDCELTVYCPDEAAWPVVDNDLLNEIPSDVKVIRRPIFEPHKYLQKKAGFEGGAGVGSQTKKGIIKNFMIWVRGNLFIPDSRKFWIKPSSKFLNSYLKENSDITHIISTGPPHSMHLIAKNLKKKYPHLKWVADFRDPWTEIDYYQELLPSKWVDKQHKKLEKSVLTKADMVISVSADCANGLERIGQRKVDIITNGFIFPEFDVKNQKLDSKFTISHFGSMPASRNPHVLWQALENVLKIQPELKNHLEIQLFGSVDFTITESLKKHQLESYFHGAKSVSHAESLLLQRQTQLLLLVANKSINSKGILTGKFFEYLGAKRPIFVVGQKDSDLQKVVNDTDSGCFIDYENITEAENYLLECFDLYQKGQLFNQAKNIEQFHSQEIARTFLKKLKELK